VVLTQILVEFPWVLELDVEVPTSTEGTHGGLLPVALPADHADLGTIGTIGERTGYAKHGEVNPIVTSPSKIPCLLTFQVRALGTKVLPSYIVSASRPKAEGREVRACQVLGRAFQHG
jgi:hypothetical protein